MPYGLDQPDWGGHYNTGQFYPLYDMAELAARLGSVLTYDRRGALIWAEDFRHGIGSWEEDHFGDDVDAALSANYWENPPFSAELIVDGTSLSWAVIERRVEVPEVTNVGLQVSVRWGAGSSKFQMYWWQYTGAVYHRAGLIADPVAETVSLFSNEGTTVLVANTGDFRDANYFAHFKIVLNLETHELVRAIALGQEYDLSAYTTQAVASGLPPSLKARIVHVSALAGESSIYIDNIIITAAEPAN